MMSIFRKDERPVVSIMFEGAAWICVALFGLAIVAIVDLIMTAAGWSR